jgi:catechol 2,3-dioxygenase-like lactoylglutathione lyase family enzyme
VGAFPFANERSPLIDQTVGRTNEEGGRMPSIAGGHHIAFTVTDADRSAQFYSDLLGMQIVMHGEDGNVKFRVLMHPDTGWVIGVRQYPGHPDGRFEEFRTGLDHFAFAVSNRQELEAWQGALAQRGIEFTPITETPIGQVIVFRDPDNIQLEFWLSPS